MIRRFDQILSPMSWLVLHLGAVPLLLVIFHPSPLEFLIFYVVEVVAVWVVRRLDGPLFLTFYPDSSGFFPDGAPEPENLSELKVGLPLFDSMVRFPRRRSLFLVVSALMKSLPGAAVILFYWHPQETLGWLALKLLAFVVLVWSYFYVAAYIESHRLISAKIAELHQRHDWKEVFAHARYPYGRLDFKIQEGLAVLLIAISAFCLHWLVSSDRYPASADTAALTPSLITIACILLITRIWYLEKLYFIGGIKSLFATMEKLDPDNTERTLPLRSTPLLAKFGRTFNEMEDKLAAYKRELATLVQYQVEESRYQAISELSALTLHDISAPLHVIQFLTDQIRESPECVKDPEYVRQLTTNVQKAVGLLQSLRSHITQSATPTTGADFMVAREHAMQLLSTQFHALHIQEIDWRFDERLDVLHFRITNADLIHTLFHLWKNSVQNLRANQVARPCIELKLVEIDQNEARIEIQDNGSGLSPERYQELTGLDANTRRPLRLAMGLRLTRRVVERNGGRLLVLPAKQGTTFHLVLPLTRDSQRTKPEAHFPATLAGEGWEKK